MKTKADSQPVMRVGDRMDGLVASDARIHLNESKTMALELKDVADGDRTLFFGIKMGWR